MAASALSVPASEAAFYPRLYEQARAALSRCEQIDECRDWANRAAAMASYARQAKDRTLIDIATRIQARAVRRTGELLLEVPAMRGVKDPANTRTQAARAAGLSSYQQATAIQVAQIPVKEFERQVEGARPPAVTRLAEQGTRGTWHAIGKERMRIIKRVQKLAEFCQVSKPERFREVLDAGDVNHIYAWCKKFLEIKP